MYDDLPADLKLLEAESIHIMREFYSEFRRPVMLYSIGKDSSVMLHIAIKAFYPAPPPFPLLHIDTTWKFQEMITFRDQTVSRLGLMLIVWRNETGLADRISPVTHDASTYTRVMKTEALKEAIRSHGFDAALGGARREEERSRAKERIFSVRNREQAWDPRTQRPELWRVWNTRLKPGQSMRVFPLSNWTELDIWRYILAENIPVVPLYFARERPVVKRDGHLIVVDDDRLPLNQGERPERRSVRFRSLGCYPLTVAFDSSAATPSEVIEELSCTNVSERQGRVIDNPGGDSMEDKKREGYF